MRDLVNEGFQTEDFNLGNAVLNEQAKMQAQKIFKEWFDSFPVIHGNFFQKDCIPYKQIQVQQGSVSGV